MAFSSKPTAWRPDGKHSKLARNASAPLIMPAEAPANKPTRMPQPIMAHNEMTVTGTLRARLHTLDLFGYFRFLVFFAFFLVFFAFAK